MWTKWSYGSFDTVRRQIKQTSPPRMRNARSETILSTVLITRNFLIKQPKTDAFITSLIWIACITDVGLKDHIDLVELIDLLKCVDLIDLVNLFEFIYWIGLEHHSAQAAGNSYQTPHAEYAKRQHSITNNNENPIKRYWMQLGQFALLSLEPLPCQ